MTFIIRCFILLLDSIRFIGVFLVTCVDFKMVLKVIEGSATSTGHVSLRYRLKCVDLSKFLLGKR